MLEAKTATRIANHLLDGSCLTIDEIAQDFSELNNQQIGVGLRILVSKRLAERTNEGCYRLTHAGRLRLEKGGVIFQGPYPAPYIEEPIEITNTLQQRSWTAMRLNSTFTTEEIALLAANEDDRWASSNIARYLHQLCKVGYLHEFPKRTRRRKRYRLMDDTGALAPVVRKDGVYDRNRKELRV